MKYFINKSVIIALILVFGLFITACDFRISSDDNGDDLPSLTGTVSFYGIAQVGETLTGDTSRLRGSGSVSYQWKRDRNEITGANDSIYIVQAEDVGCLIALTATRSGYSGSITSISVIPIAATVTFSDLSADGSAAQTTTQLTLTFSRAIAGLTANDITLNGVSGVNKGTLDGSGPVYTLTIDGFISGGTLTAEVEKPGYTIAPTSRTVTIFTAEAAVTSPYSTLVIAFTQIADAAPAITGPTLYRVSNGGPTSATITVNNPQQYSSINWQVQNSSVTGTGPSFTLNAANTAYNLIGERFLTVMVIKDGVPYNKTVSFRVEY